MNIRQITTYENDDGFQFTYQPIDDTIRITENENGYEISYLTYDTDPQNPREWDNMGKMICFHKKYTLGDKHDETPENFNGWTDLRNYLIKEKNASVILPLFLYDHGQISISAAGDTYPYNDRWDAGQVGFIYCTDEDIKNGLGAHDKPDYERAKKILLGEVGTYNEFLTGDVYAVVREIYDKNKKRLDHDAVYGYHGFNESLSELNAEAQK